MLETSFFIRDKSLENGPFYFLCYYLHKSFYESNDRWIEHGKVFCLGCRTCSSPTYSGQLDIIELGQGAVYKHFELQLSEQEHFYTWSFDTKIKGFVYRLYSWKVVW